MPGAYRYEIGACLGRGGFGEVYRAARGGAGALVTDVAVKVLRSTGDADAVARLRDEARVLASLDHPAILKVLDLVQLDGRPALIAEYVDGADVDAVAPIPARAALEAIATLADGLAAAHRAGVVHRDVKPTNVRIGRHAQVKLLDFGIVWTASPDREVRTASGVIIGSAAYMAPERFSEGPSGAAADVFGLGCVLYEALTGRPLLAGLSLPALAGIASDPARLDARLERALAGTPGDLAALLRAMLAFEPGDRPLSADLAARIESIGSAHDGPPLRAWCRTRAWAPPRTDVGPLTGRRIVAEPLVFSDGGPLSEEPTLEDATLFATALHPARPGPRPVRLDGPAAPSEPGHTESNGARPPLRR